jgi:hypothetical protein
LPFNALHHHAEDEHHIAIVSHQKDHSCELDEHICQGEFTGECDHSEHIRTTLPKCFSCQFHFIKTFEAANICSTGIFSDKVYSYFFSSYDLVASEANSIQNKGPPFIS